MGIFEFQGKTFRAFENKSEVALGDFYKKFIGGERFGETLVFSG